MDWEERMRGMLEEEVDRVRNEGEERVNELERDAGREKKRVTGQAEEKGMGGKE